jgi:hypothetical protein
MSAKLCAASKDDQSLHMNVMQRLLPISITHLRPILPDQSPQLPPKRVSPRARRRCAVHPSTPARIPGPPLGHPSPCAVRGVGGSGPADGPSRLRLASNTSHQGSWPAPRSEQRGSGRQRRADRAAPLAAAVQVAPTKPGRCRCRRDDGSLLNGMLSQKVGLVPDWWIVLAVPGHYA